VFRELILLRHAKSAWPIGVRDVDRPLASRGRDNAALFGRWLRDQGVTVDAVVLSPSQRTRSTVELMTSAGGLDDAEIATDERLYASSWWDVLDVVREQKPELERLLVVGHNPSLEDLASQLARPNSDPESMRRLRAKFPTGSAAFLTSSEPWRTWGTDCARLDRLWTPRTL
jgi:phosphohistidine phosphatase